MGQHLVQAGCGRGEQRLFVFGSGHGHGRHDSGLDPQLLDLLPRAGEPGRVLPHARAAEHQVRVSVDEARSHGPTLRVDDGCGRAVVPLTQLGFGAHREDLPLSHRDAPARDAIALGTSGVRHAAAGEDFGCADDEQLGRGPFGRKYGRHRRSVQQCRFDDLVDREVVRLQVEADHLLESAERHRPDELRSGDLDTVS